MWSDRNLPPIMSYGGSDRYENQKDMHFNLLGEWKYYGAKTSISFNMGYNYATLGYILSNSNPGGIWVNFDTRSVSHVFSNKLNVQHNLSDKAVWKTSAEAVFTQASYNDKIEQTGFDVDRTDINLQTSYHYVFQELFRGMLLLSRKWSTIS
ncbi:MAG: hypothetical protein HC905_03655 [Bacteroidales bacterium]|nr:hypothetical protein [Bacteroidales bacterium]